MGPHDIRNCRSNVHPFFLVSGFPIQFSDRGWSNSIRREKAVRQIRKLAMAFGVLMVSVGIGIAVPGMASAEDPRSCIGTTDGGNAAATACFYPGGEYLQVCDDQDDDSYGGWVRLTRVHDGQVIRTLRADGGGGSCSPKVQLHLNEGTVFRMKVCRYRGNDIDESTCNSMRVVA
jgi:hypothetical protein